ncbi:G-type lectin S-receptor-like serine/threonine-protein kinase LECRK3 [Andrographis paniculata]|uniref:G-type lectin S-receptor-like serine/threonine-protein kinase LECRK3 n=1 Tax=Andrographis paniculata TaxID=175694 RepID=UPI0021E95243|nr:G-type lectin S-receptor-like serine/threonine-protein kinase LECRK3 [Andrographis paniculata]
MQIIGVPSAPLFQTTAGMASLAIFPAIVVFFHILITIAQSYTNISLGSSISTNGPDSPWKSPSGEFAFGFLAVPGAGGYLLSIWFDKLPDKTVVWSANRDSPAPPGSKIQLFDDGRFELSDKRGRRIWAAGGIPSGAGVAYAAMLDTGNFVLARNDSTAAWQTFDSPTDTLLPAQALNRGDSLISRFSGENYSRGRFTFIMQDDGNLVLYTRNFPLYDVVSAYWSTQTVGTGSRLVFNESGYIYLTGRDGAVIFFLASNPVPADRFYQRLTLQYDGVLRHYFRPKSGGSGWSVNVYFPSNICLRILQSTGGGACGFNSLCSIGGDRNPNCACPEGYSLVNPSDKLGDCKPDFAPQSCNNSKESELYGFVEMVDTDWPLSDYAHFDPVSEEWCRQECLVDCFCAVAIYRESNCWKKKFPLSNGRIDATVGGKALIKIRKINGTRETMNPHR